MKKVFGIVCAIGIGLSFWGCASIPPGATAVSGFEPAKYLGKWYEIARFDFAFEKDLNNTTAEYSLLPDGKIQVVNRGYNYKTNTWSQADGKARFKGSDTIGALEVSFFGPFYAAYNVIAIDKDYQYALIAGSSTKYLWLLSRTKEIPPDIRADYLGIAQKIGYDLDKLIWVEHND